MKFFFWDEWLIDNVYQRIVDYTEQTGKECSRFCLVGVGLATILETYFGKQDAASLTAGVVNLFFITILYATNSSTTYNRFSIFKRLLRLGMILNMFKYVILFSLNMLTYDMLTLARFLDAFMFMNYLYYEACGKPRPRKKKYAKTFGKFAFQN